MQNSQSIRTGDLVAIRRRRWRVVEVRPFDRCQLLTLQPIGTRGGERRRFLLPFEHVERLDRRRSVKAVGRDRWRRACRALIADRTPPGALRTARTARIDVLPHQLEPALAVIAGRGCRVLLADDVGLGKTVQAGLIAAELRARAAADRVLIVTPAGLRDQWRTELAGRFGMFADVFDVRQVRRTVSTLPAGMNPWITAPIVITSIDYLKRTDVMRAAAACAWDVVVIDEAHGVARDTDRHAAVAALTARAAYVLLLTATPHSGDTRAFAALCGLGAQDDALLVFRRTRGDVNLGVRRHVHQLHVRLSADEARMHALLREFTAVVRREHDSPAAWLALSVLHKRAFSSARALELTVARRLASTADAAVRDVQLSLPLADPGGEFDSADEPPDCLASLALVDRGHERQLLTSLLDAARRATRRETKLDAVRRLLRRIDEPIVVFTEFRDTLLHLCAACRRLDANRFHAGTAMAARPVIVLHGGLTREARTLALDQFIAHPRSVLLATDAAGEGLNLHQHCRVVVNLELPWNPMRLEQRIGRVDRIGQRRTIHVFHLIARATGEAAVLDHLRKRIARARQDIAVADPLNGDDAVMARAMIDGGEIVDQTAHSSPHASGADAPRCERVSVDLRLESRAECERLVAARALGAGTTGDDDGASLAASGPWLTRARSAIRRSLLDRVLLLLEVSAEDGAAALAARLVIPIEIALGPQTVRRPIGSIRRLLERHWTEIESRAIAAGEADSQEVTSATRRFLSARLSRDHRIAASLAAATHVAIQPGLFDRRAERLNAIREASTRDVAAQIARRIALAEHPAVAIAPTVRLLLALIP